MTDFSKMLYWADRFGDSTITKTLAYRDGLKLFNFGKGFKKATGITVKQFEENWRRPYEYLLLRLSFTKRNL